MAARRPRSALSILLACDSRNLGYSVLASVPALIFFGLALVALSSPAQAQNTWNGGTGKWSTGSDWSTGASPDGSTNISIPTGTVQGDTSFTNLHTLDIGIPATLNVLSTTTITNLGASAEINNSGTLANDSGTLANGGTIVNTIFGTLNNNSGGTIINDVSSTIENDQRFNNNSGATLTNSGTLNGTGRFVNDGTVNNFGSFSNAVSNHGGTIKNLGGSVQFGGFSNIDGGTLNNVAGTLGVAGVGNEVSLVGNGGFGAVTIQGTYTSDVGTTTDVGGLIINKGNIQVKSGGGLDTHLILFASTTLQGGGTVTLANVGGTGSVMIDSSTTGLMTLTNADNTIQGAGSINHVRLVNQAGAAINSNVAGQALVLTNSEVTNNGGIVNQMGARLSSNGTIDNNATLTNRLSGLFTNSGGTINNNSGGIITNDASSTIENIGRFFNKSGATLMNSGMLDGGGLFVNDGTVNNLGSFSNFVVNHGATINNMGGSVELLDGSDIEGGTLNNAGGTLGVKAPGATVILNGDAVFGAVTIRGTYTGDVGTTTKLLGTINNTAGAQMVNQGTFLDVPGVVHGTVINNAGTIINNGVFANQGGSTLTNTGVLNNTDSLSNSGLFQVASAGVLNNTGIISNGFGGDFVVQSGGTFNNSGSFRSDSFSTFGSQANSTILNAGDMSLGGNTVAIGGSLRNNGTITMVAGPTTGDSTIQPPAPPLLITSTGKLSGTGTVNQGLFGFGVINQGVMAPGDPLGTFTIVGNYEQTATGTLEILLGGTGAGQFSQLDITGGADLGGTLDVKLFAGFDPQAGEMFEILESGGVTNLDFLSMLFPSLSDGLFFKLDQVGGNLFLDVMQGEDGGGGGTSAPEPGTGVLLLSAIAMAFGGSRLRKRRLMRRF